MNGAHDVPKAELRRIESKILNESRDGDSGYAGPDALFATGWKISAITFRSQFIAGCRDTDDAGRYFIGQRFNRVTNLIHTAKAGTDYRCDFVERGREGQR